MSTISPLIICVLALSLGVLASICGAMLANSVGELSFRNECLIYIVIFCCALHWLRRYMKGKLQEGDNHGKNNGKK